MYLHIMVGRRIKKHVNYRSEPFMFFAIAAIILILINYFSPVSSQNHFAVAAFLFASFTLSYTNAKYFFEVRDHVLQ